MGLFVTFLQTHPELGVHVLSLRIEASPSGDVHAPCHNTVQRILESTPRIRSICTGLALQGPFFPTLSGLFQHTLTFLSVIIHENVWEALASVAKLRNLRALSLHIRPDWPDTLPSLLSLPHVHAFYIQTPPEAGRHFWKWLAMSRFRTDCALFLTPIQHMGSDQWLAMNPFFDAHACSCVHIVAWDVDSHTDSGSHIFSRSHKVDFGLDIIPHIDLFRAQRLPAAIYFTVSPDAESEAGAARSIIRVLCETTFAHNLQLHIRIWPHEDWQQLEEIQADERQETNDTAQLLLYVEARKSFLNQNGVRVLYDDPNERSLGFDDREWMYATAGC